MAGRPDITAVEVCLDSETNPLWVTYRIEVVPSVLFFKDGTVVRRLDGAPLVGVRVLDLEQALAAF